MEKGTRYHRLCPPARVGFLFSTNFLIPYTAFFIFFIFCFHGPALPWFRFPLRGFVSQLVHCTSRFQFSFFGSESVWADLCHVVVVSTSVEYELSVQFRLWQL